jgi:hypothetical protein
VDNDGDGATDIVGVGDAGCKPSTSLAPADADGDGWSDEAEIHIGTDALGRCEVGPSTSATLPSRDWPGDLKADGVSADKADLSDIGTFFAPVNHFNTSPGAAGFDRRWDLIPGSAAGDWVGSQDLGALLAGGTSTPAMFSGAAIFNGPSCTAHPTLND